MTTTMPSLSDRFVRALETFDVDAMIGLLAPDAILWLNLGNRDRTVEELTATLAVESKVVREATVTLRHQSDTNDGFVVQLMMEGTTQGGAEFTIPVCIVAHVADDKITGFEEYSDQASVAPLQQEFLAALSS